LKKKTMKNIYKRRKKTKRKKKRKKPEKTIGDLAGGKAKSVSKISASREEIARPSSMSMAG